MHLFGIKFILFTQIVRWQRIINFCLLYQIKWVNIILRAMQDGLRSPIFLPSVPVTWNFQTLKLEGRGIHEKNGAP